MNPSRILLPLLSILLAASVAPVGAQTTLADTSSFTRTPPAPHTPRINGPRVYGERPGKPFFYHLPVTGDRPMTISAEKLPDGLTLDAATGNITGSVATAGTYEVKFTAKNALGENSRTLSFIVGPQICLTPPMGWNSWNCFGGNIDETKIRGAADAMVKTGLVDHGWTYINMDDRWESAQRDAQGNIQGSAGFPDMKAMADYIHGLGLKVGLYSSPGPFTCAGAPGSFQHEDQDAAQYAAWGMDYLKYDLCSYQENQILTRAEAFAQALPKDAAQIMALARKQYDNAEAYRKTPGNTPEGQAQRQQLSAQWHVMSDQLDHLYHHLQGPKLGEIYAESDRVPYRIMRASLDKVNRDIVYSLCQYGMGEVQTWGAEIGGNTWRVTGDINPNWKSVEQHGFELQPESGDLADGGRISGSGVVSDFICSLAMARRILISTWRYILLDSFIRTPWFHKQKQVIFLFS